MKKKTKIFIAIIFIIFVAQFAIFQERVFATETATKTGFWTDVFNKGDEFISDGKKALAESQRDDTAGGIDEKALKRNSAEMFNVAVGIGTILTVIIGGILGIKFMIASAAEDKAKIKEMLIPYVIGCAIIFGAFSIWKIVIDLLNNLT